MNNIQRLRLGLYTTGILIVILSRVTTFIEYNVAMSIASFILSVTLCIDAYVFLENKKKFRAGLCIFFSVLVLLLLIYLWIFKI